MRTTTSSLLLTALFFSCAAVAQQAQEAGALRLTWDEGGRIARVECARRDVTGPGVSFSGFALRDCAVQKDYEPISCEVTRGGNSIRLAGRNAVGALALSVECVAEKDWLVLRGVVENLTDTDHAVSLRFALPVACKGWTWHTRLHKTEPLIPGKAMHLGLPGPLGSGYLALRPVAAVSDAAHTVGLVMPVDHKGQYDFMADPDAGLFSVVIDFAMTKHCPRFFKKVPFEFAVAAEADGWGLRSVLDRCYANRPEFFNRHTPEAGGWFAWGDILRQPPPVCDYGLMFHEQPEAKSGCANDKALGIQVYPYIEPIMYQMCLGDQPADKAPERGFIIQRLRDWAKPETTGRLPSGGYGTQDDLQKICHAILTSGVKDPKGNVVIGGVGQYNWISGSKWAAQFPLNLCPAVPDGAGQGRLQFVREKLLTVPYLSGIYLDSYSAHLQRVNYGQDQLQYISYPPQFDAKTFQPCVLNAFAVWEWVDALWEMLPDEKKALLPNLYGQQVPFPWHRFTVMGKEHWVGATGPLMQQYRAMACRKVVTQLPAYEDRDERFLRNLMLLDVFPGGYARRPTDPPLGMRAAYRVVIPLLRQLHRLGWAPVTHAKGETWIERYGSAPGPVCLAVHNPYDAGIVRIIIDAQRLGLPQDAVVVDAVDGEPVEFSRTENLLNAAIGMRGNWTTLLVVGGKEARAGWHRMLADDRLDDVRLCLKEQALRNGADAHPAGGAASNLTSARRPDELAAAAKAITGDAPAEARARDLLDLAAVHIRRAENPEAVSSRAPFLPKSDVVLPWMETFDALSPERWRFNQEKQTKGAAVANGRLELELPRDATAAGVHTLEQWPFVPRPLIIEADFKYTHGDHDRYLMFSMKICSTPTGDGEYLLVRVDGSRKDQAQVRVENHNAPPTNWQHTLTEWTPFDASKPRHLLLRLDRSNFRLELDGQPVGEGPHECGFAWAHIILGVNSGHKGHGDVCWWDNLKVYRAIEDPTTRDDK
ncbi:MAG: hypothetical protein AB1696_16900 [Planctomycetota bacterium]